MAQQTFSVTPYYRVAGRKFPLTHEGWTRAKKRARFYSTPNGTTSVEIFVVGRDGSATPVGVSYFGGEVRAIPPRGCWA